MFALFSNQLNTMSSSPSHKDTSNPLDPTTVVTSNRRGPLLEGGHSTKICGMWNLYCRSPYQTQNNLDYLQLEIVKINPQREKNLCPNCLWNFEINSL